MRLVRTGTTVREMLCLYDADTHIGIDTTLVTNGLRTYKHTDDNSCPCAPIAEREPTARCEPPLSILTRCLRRAVRGSTLCSLLARIALSVRERISGCRGLKLSSRR